MSIERFLLMFFPLPLTGCFGEFPAGIDCKQQPNHEACIDFKPDAGEGPGEDGCESNDDCPATQQCTAARECIACPGGPAPEVCDGNTDDDCDGNIDEGCDCVDGDLRNRRCGLNERSIATDSCISGRWVTGDCEDSDVCLDGDEEPCGSNVGQCQFGTKTCVNGRWSDCVGGTEPGPEVCGNGLDDDCDGVEDDVEQECQGCDPNGFLPEPCEVFGAQGACAAGETACSELGVVSCRQQTFPAAETCDDIDNDCNGVVDDLIGVGDACTVGLGVCQVGGQFACDSNLGGIVCDAEAPAPMGEERCDGELDEDCDGSVDEGCECLGDWTQPVTCGVGSCQRNGQRRCDNGIDVTECQIGAPLDDIDDSCNGIDEDCDGRIDEGYQPEPTSCGVGACRSAGLTACQDGEIIDTCEPGPPLPEVCDAADNDCNGVIDDHFENLNTPCTVGVGACEVPGMTVCSEDGAGTVCFPQGGQLPDPAANDHCNGIDDDCDGNTDEDFARELIACGEGLCRAEGLLVCQNGERVERCEPGQPEPERCDGELDDDCDGEVDEGCDCVSGDRRNCGSNVGACQPGEQICGEDGQWSDCIGEATPAAIESCNGLDDDCDGNIDEEILGTGEACNVGVGACSNEGVTVCRPELGGLGCSVDSLPPGEERCDEIDNDCDGEIDEGYNVGGACTVGLGECRVNGRLACDPEVPAGISCVVNEEVLPIEEICDGFDNDCDGETDEQLDCQCAEGDERPCGDFNTGVCQFGTQVCDDQGQWSDCDGAINPGVEACNELDDDCDGVADEGTFNACGACGDLPEELCSGQDEDCDGETDEGFGLGEYCQNNSCATGIPGFAECDAADPTRTTCGGCAQNPWDAPLTESWDNGGLLTFTYSFEDGHWTCRDFSGGNNLVVTARDENDRPLFAILRNAGGCGNGQQTERWEYSYDALGRLTETRRFRIQDDQLRRVIIFAYDGDSTRIVSQTWEDPFGQFQRAYAYVLDLGGNPMFMMETNDLGEVIPAGEIRDFAYAPMAFEQ